MNLNLRKASDTPFPYGWPGIIMYAAIDADGNLEQVSNLRDDFRSAVRRAAAGEIRLIAAWPGQYRTDLFEIDEPSDLADAIGLKSVGA